MLRKLLLVLTMLILFLFLSPLPAQAADTETKIYKFAVTDIVGLEELQREFQAFQDKLNTLTGYQFQLFPVTGRTVVVESLRAKRLDFALTGPAEYVAITSRTTARPLVGLKRPNYQAAIIALKSSHFASLQDLKGKKIGFGDFGSTSYHLAPLQLFADAGLDPKHDIHAVNLNKHIAWKALLRHQVAAIGFSAARFVQFIDEDPKIHREDFDILATGPILPSDLFIAGAHVPQAVGDALKKAFREHGDEILQSMLVGKRNAKYMTMTFKTNIIDSDYDYIRTIYRTAGLENLARRAKSSRSSK